MTGFLRVKIDRDSVCAGDDCDRHRLCVWMSKDSTYDDLVNKIKRKRFFPGVYGNDEIWVLTDACHTCICTYYKGKGLIRDGLAEKRLGKIYDKKGLKFKYYCGANEWKEAVLAMPEGMLNEQVEKWRDKETEYCDALIEKRSNG